MNRRLGCVRGLSGKCLFHYCDLNRCLPHMVYNITTLNRLPILTQRTACTANVILNWMPLQNDG